MSEQFSYNEDQIILIVDNSPPLLACVMELTKRHSDETLPEQLKNFFESGQATNMIAYRDQVSKDALRRELMCFRHFPQDRQNAYWQDAAKYYREKQTEGVDMGWALPDNWR